MGRVGKSIGAAGQQSGKLAGKERVSGLAVVLLREQNPGQGSICPRQEGVATRPRLETRGLRERTGTAIEAGADLPPVRGVDKPDRHRSDAAWRQEHRMHKLGSTSTLPLLPCCSAEFQLRPPLARARRIVRCSGNPPHRRARNTLMYRARRRCYAELKMVLFNLTAAAAR